MATRCEGWRRYGGAFSLGPVTWSQCLNDAVVMLTVTQDGKTEQLPACMECWNEAIERKIKISEVLPLEATVKT